MCLQGKSYYRLHECYTDITSDVPVSFREGWMREGVSKTRSNQEDRVVTEPTEHGQQGDLQMYRLK